MKHSTERTFLHDLATPLSLLKLHLKRLSRMVESSPDSKEIKTQKELLAEMITAVNKMEDLHCDFKAHISKNESK